MIDRKSLRHTLIEKRKQLSEDKVLQHAQQLTAHFANHPLFLAAQHIAFYHAIGQELSVTPLIAIAQQLNKHCYLPVMHPDSKTLTFFSFRPGDSLINNRVNIAEPNPDTAKEISAHDLDLVFTPMVGWDHHGNRLGMGAGYYDRTFAFLQQAERTQQRPWLVGIAHEVQFSSHLEAMPWDIWMIGIATEKQYYAVVDLKKIIVAIVNPPYER